MELSRTPETSLVAGNVIDYRVSMEAKSGLYEKASAAPCRELVGGLLHHSNTTRFDITFAASFFHDFLKIPMKFTGSQGSMYSDSSRGQKISESCRM